MAKKDLYLTQNGTLMKKQNTIWFENSQKKRPLPVAQVNAVYCFGEVTLNSKLLDFFTKHQIPIYFFNYYGFYSGSYVPKRQNVSGTLLIEQVKHYEDSSKRLTIAREFLMSCYENMRFNLVYYNVNEQERFREFKKKLEEAQGIQNLMLEEARMRQFYYRCFNEILKKEEFYFNKRVKQPPDNFINTLISFGNSLYYTVVLSELFKTQLDPTISYLHEPFERRYSLNLDIAEIFKPVIVDRVIFTLVNKGMIRDEHFDKKMKYCYLNEEGRKIFARAFDEKLCDTFKHKRLGRKISYRYLARMEAYKLIKHLFEGEPYVGFRMEKCM